MPSSPPAPRELCTSCRQKPALVPLPFCASCLLASAGTSAPQAAARPQPRLPPGTRIGPYQILELLGEGGFAEVYSARSPHGSPDLFALKIIKRGMDSREILSRFRAEQRTLQALSHSCIVPLLDAGITDEGLSWFAMERIDGLPITDHCHIAELTLRERLHLFLRLCDAIQHAHQKGVLHRDLKPSNILVAETPDGPIPKVIDFGIARALDPSASGDHTLVTQLGQVLGTPACMSPEQADGNDAADTRSDIYSLGAVLYEMLTGAPPFALETWARLPAAEWAGHLREHLPPLASSHPSPLSPFLRGDLDQILRKAMAPEPASRYPTTAAFADDLQLWLDDRPVSARPPTAGQLLRQFTRRHRWPVAVGLSLLAGIVATAGIGTYHAIAARQAEARALHQKDRALQAEVLARTARDRADHHDYQTSIELATLHLARGEPYLAAQKLRATSAHLRGWEWGHLLAQIASPQASAESGLAQPGVLAATPDGQLAAVAEGKTLRILHLPTGYLLAARTLRGSIERLALSHDGLRIAALESRPEGNNLHVSRIDGSEPWDLPIFGSKADLAWEPPAPGSALLLVTGYSETPVVGRLIRLDPATGRIVNERPITRFKTHARSLAIGRGGTMAVVENSYKDLEIVALPSLELIFKNEDPDGVGAEAFLVDDARRRVLVARGPHLYSSSIDPIGPMGPPSPKGPMPPGSPATLVGTLATGEATPTAIRRLNWLPDGRWIATSDTLQLIEGKPTAQPLPAAGAIAMEPLDEGRHLALLGAGRLEIRPELPPAPATAAYPGGDDAEGRGTAFSPDSRQAYFQNWRRNTLQMLSLRPAEPLQPAATPHPSGHSGAMDPVSRTGPVSSATTIALPKQPEAEWTTFPVIHPDGSVLTRVGASLALLSGNAAPFLFPQTTGAWSAAVSPDGAQLAVGLPDRVLLFDWKTRTLLREWSLPAGPFCVGFYPRAIVALGRDATLHLLPFHGPAHSCDLPVRINGFHPAPVAFQANPPLLAAALYGGGYALYDMANLAAGPRLLQRHTSVANVTALAFSPYTTPDSQRLAVATDDHRLAIWDWRYSLPLLSFPINSTCASVAFSPDGRWLANTDYAPALVLRRGGTFSTTNGHQ